MSESGAAAARGDNRRHVPSLASEDRVKVHQYYPLAELVNLVLRCQKRCKDTKIQHVCLSHSASSPGAFRGSAHHSRLFLQRQPSISGEDGPCFFPFFR